MADKSVPTLFEWLGGMPALDRLMSRFYERVKDDPILAPIFAKMSGDHPHHVAVFLAEVLGGPTGYSEQFGGHPRMIQRHLNRHLTQAQRRQWVSLLLDTADQIGMPDDPDTARSRRGSKSPDAEVGLGGSQGTVQGLSAVVGEQR